MKDNVISFERDAAFYLKKGVSHYRHNRMDRALFYFRKAVNAEPFNAFNHYNLACMLSKTGRLQEANRVFLHILEKLNPQMTECYFLLAINYGLLGNLNKSRLYLRKYLQADPEGDLAAEAAELLAVLSENSDDSPPVYTERDFCLEKNLFAMARKDLLALLQGSQELRQILCRWLYDGPDGFKEEIILLYRELGGEAAKRVLLDFIKNPWIKERFRHLAILVLRKLGVSGSVSIFSSGKLREAKLSQFSKIRPEWRREWQQVIDCAVHNMRRSNCYEQGFFDDVQAIWRDYINNVYPDTPRIVKVETWAAALEYCLARFHYLNLTQKKLAAEYGVSCASISRNFRAMNKVLQLDEKAYRNMLSYIKGD
ncbi:MAG: hypothetical protein QM368_04090 [Bacillota bacterium]|nr:hypothetical protein [Bacillota bacterium]HHU29654.1 hypothetical protein [Bacillota bacterium]